MRTRFFLAACALILLSNCSNNKKNEPSFDTTVLYSEYHNFENSLHSTAVEKNAFEGKKCSSVTPEIEYGFGVFKLFKDVPSYESVNKLKVSLYCLMEKTIPEATLVLSIDDTLNHKSITWNGKSLDSKPSGNWNFIDYEFDINAEWLKPQNMISVYVWNKTKNTFYIDNMRVEFLMVSPHKK